MRKVLGEEDATNKKTIYIWAVENVGNFSINMLKVNGRNS